MYWPCDPDHPVTKVCTKCGEEKHLMEFYLNYKRGRRVARCRECVGARRREYYMANWEHCQALWRRREAANRQQRLALRRRWYARNAEACRAGTRRCRAAHAEERRAANRRWQQEHPESFREYARRYRARHPDKMLARRATRCLRAMGLIELAPHCADCGGKAAEHHHWSYESPFAVVSLCRPCHRARHRAERRREEEGR